MAGTIITDKIESDATYDSKIELASPVLVSNTFAVKSTGGTGVFNIVGANTNTDRTFTLPDNTGTLVTTDDILVEVSSGSVIWYAANTAPTGYLKANGAAVSRTTYASLFAAIGTTFGAGDGSTTFLLPDLRGEFIRGWADNRAVDTGRVFGSTQAQAIESHQHVIRSDNSVGNGVYNASSTGFSRVNLTNTAGGTETRPRNIALLACIKF